MQKRKFMGRLLAAPALCLVLVIVFLMPADLPARGGGDRDRHRFYGWVEYMPEGFHGTWIIGGRRVTTNPRTRFDQREGPLMVGVCAKVDIRNGLVHEIDSEPPGDCLRK